MNIVIINGSPRTNGNSDLLCDEFIRGARESGNQTEKVSLREYTVSPCRACYACFKTGKCVQKDDMAEILNKIKNADVLVLASPTYFMTMTGQMKVFIDRLLPEWQGLGGKDVYIIVTGHDNKEGLKRTAGDLSDIFSYLGNTVKSIIWGEGVWQKGEVIGTKAMDEAYHAGNNIGR